MSLDAKLSPAPSDAKHQNDVGLLREELRQFAIDRTVSRGEDVDATIKGGESRPAPTCKCLGKSSARIEGRAGKWTEAGDQYAHVQSPSISAIFSTADAGARRPAATSDSIFGNAALTARSDCSGA